MADSELVSELARRAGVSRADAEAVLEALAQVAPEHVHAARSSPAADAEPLGAATTPGGSGEVDTRLHPAGADAATELRRQVMAPYVPGAGEVGALIAAAGQHPLGVEFLLDGDLAAVAITFRTHAFTVEAARRRLRPDERQAGGP
jgi:hypothetical protein